MRTKMIIGCSMAMAARIEAMERLVKFNLPAAATTKAGDVDRVCAIQFVDECHRAAAVLQVSQLSKQ